MENPQVDQQVEPSPELQPGTYESFIAFHGIQLYAVGFPTQLYQRLYEKLKEQVFDIGYKVKIVVNEEDEKIELVTTETGFKADEDVYLVDHAWTFKYRDAEKTLRENEALLERIMTGITRFAEKLDLPENPYKTKKPTLQEYLHQIDQDTKVYDFDDYGIANLDLIPFSQNAEEISLFNNKIENPGQITTFLLPLPNLKALWLNGNPVVDSCVNFNSIGEMMPSLEILNSTFTSKAGKWAMLFYARDQKPQTLADIKELNLAGRGVLHIQELGVFDEMTNLTTLNISEHPEFFMTEEQIEEMQKEQKEGALVQGQGNIEFMQKLHTIDELLLKLTSVKKLICDEDLEDYILATRQDKGFLPNLIEINRVSIKITDKDARLKEKDIRHVMDKLWMFLGTYRIVKETQMDEENVWYLMDEVGSAMKHSDQPNFAVHPFIYSPNNNLDESTITYSISWPLKNIGPNETIYRDFLEGIDETKFRSTRLSVWFNTPEEYFLKQLETLRSIKPAADPDAIHQKIQQKYPPVPSLKEVYNGELPIKVYTDYVQIQEHINDPRFQLIDDPFQSQIAWVTVDYYAILRKKVNLDATLQHFNQFQFEGSLVMKHYLANLVRYTLKEEDQNIIQETYVLNDYLPAFVGRYLEKKKLAEDNTWILKPINMARSMDSWVTSNLDQILRTVETGPKIAQKYINNTCLYKGKKFDMRFVILLKSVLPLEVYVYDEFYTRHSNNAYDMSESSFSDYETHFTVMNYKPGVTLQNVRYFDFEKSFNEEYAGVITFDVIKSRIYDAIKKLFIAFQVKHHEEFEKLGEGSRRCRSIYGIDVMINSDFEPRILEATFSPDCKRACRFNPDFFNEIFGCLFFDDSKNVTRI